ncbi:MAG: ABC transporter ATP-binding protein [Myxococcota bacterium]
MPTPEPPKSYLKQVRMLVGNVRRAVGIAWRFERSLTLRYVLVNIISALLPVAIAYVGKRIVDAVVDAIADPAHPVGPSLTWVGVELGLILAGHFAGQAIGYFGQLLRARLALHIDQLIFEKALRLSVMHFEDAEFMDMLERARKESGWRPVEMITHGLRLGRNVVTLVGYAILLAQFSGWAVLALALAGLPFLAETRYASEQYRIHQARTSRERQAYYLQQLLTSDYYVKEIKLFTLGPELLRRHRDLHEGFYKEDRDFAFRRGRAVTLLGAVSTAVFYGIYVVIVGATVATRISLGDMTLYLTVFRQGQDAFQSAMSSIARAWEDNLYMANLFAYLAIDDDDLAETALGALPEEPAPAVRFEGVSFHYPGSKRPALHEIDLAIEPGETIALVGPNGAGKTTLVKLLVGLYSLREGRIRIGERDIADMDRGELRQRIGVLFQDFVHYHFSAAENIGIGWLPKMEDRDAVTRAAEDAGADGIVRSLPEDYDTMLGRWFGGEQLSIGQWQRMALARAFMRRSNVLILDEPTAAIDAEGEHEIFQRFQELKEDATCILITHRFSTVRMADRIVVLDKGRIVEVGRHDELIAKDGLYAKMFNLQAEGYAIPTDPASA